MAFEYIIFLSLQRLCSINELVGRIFWSWSGSSSLLILHLTNTDTDSINLNVAVYLELKSNPYTILSDVIMTLKMVVDELMF